MPMKTYGIPVKFSMKETQKKMMKCFADAFKAGAEWRINHAWHKAEDLPQHNAWFLAQIGNDCFKTFKMRREYDRWEQW